MNVKYDAMWVGTKNAGTSELAPTEGDVTRRGLILQGERVFEAGNGATSPSAAVGLRRDGGDAETGTGVEIGGGSATPQTRSPSNGRYGRWCVNPRYGRWCVNPRSVTADPRQV